MPTIAATVTAFRDRVMLATHAPNDENRADVAQHEQKASPTLQSMKHRFVTLRSRYIKQIRLISSDGLQRRPDLLDAVPYNLQSRPDLLDAPITSTPIRPS